MAGSYWGEAVNLVGGGGVGMGSTKPLGAHKFLILQIIYFMSLEETMFY